MMPPQKRNQVDHLAGQYYEMLVNHGEGILGADPLCRLEGPGSGSVVWSNESGSHAGYLVSAVRPQLWFGGKADFNQLGFPDSACAEGIWAVQETTFAPDQNSNGLMQVAGEGNLLAYYSTRHDSWSVRRRKVLAEANVPWLDRWERATNKLEPKELASITRVAEESDALLDVVRSLGESDFALDALITALRQRARESGVETDQQRLEAVLNSQYEQYDVLGGSVGHLVRDMFDHSFAHLPGISEKSAQDRGRSYPIPPYPRRTQDVGS